MGIVDLILLFIIFSYVVLMLILAIAFWFPVELKRNIEVNGFSILVPFKNEQEQIQQLVESLKKSYLNYSIKNVEVLFINDHSTDASVNVLHQALVNFPFQHQIIHQNEDDNGKKKAIILGVSQAKYERIITLDADCVIDENWLFEITKLTYGLGIGIVVQNDETNTYSLLNAIQITEGLLLQGITIGSANVSIPLLCSGANLTYSKDDFIKFEPYKDNIEIASGDDMFLLNCFIENQIEAVPIKKAKVYTQTEKDVTNYIKRSVRWASKTSDLKMPVLMFISILTFAVNLIFINSLFIWLFEGGQMHFFNCLIKFLVDFLFLFSLSIALKKLYLLIFAPLIALVYPIYLIAIAIMMIRYNKKEWN